MSRIVGERRVLRAALVVAVLRESPVVNGVETRGPAQRTELRSSR
jgi:hypothetical protein